MYAMNAIHKLLNFIWENSIVLTIKSLMGTELTGHLNGILTDVIIWNQIYILGHKNVLQFGIKYIAGIREWIITGYLQTDRKLLNHCRRYNVR